MQLRPSWKKAGVISGLIGSACLHQVYAQDPPLFLVDSAPPPGFEKLNQPQTTALDIYYGGRFITSQLATYTNNWVKLSNPKALLNNISDIIAPDVILNALKGSLKTHANQVCYNRQQKDCGMLKPSVAGVIFDESTFKLTLFINPAYLKLNPALSRIYLPPSDGGLSFIQQLSGNFSGTRSKENHNSDYTFTGSSLFALKENHFQVNYDYSKANRLSLDNAFFQREFQGREWQAGLISTQGFGMSFSGDNPMWGLRLSSSTNTRLDKGVSEGTPIQFFMPSQGRVDVIKDGRLIYTHFEEAGNHVLNTSGFPAGSYNITLRLRDNNGRILSEQTRFFARDFSLPNAKAPEYFVEAGKIVERTSDKVVPGTTQNVIARAGINYRLSDTWAGTAAYAATQGQSFAELGLFHIGRHYKIAPGLMISPNRSHGIKLDAQVDWRDFTAGVNYRHLWNTHNAAVTTTVINGTTTTSSTTDTFNLLQNSFEQTDFNLSAPFIGGRLGYRVTYRTQKGSDAERIHAVDYSRTLYENNTYALTSRFSFSETKTDKVALLNIEFRWNSNDQFSHSLSTQGEWAKNNNGDLRRDGYLRYDMSYNSGTTLDEDINANLSAQKSKNQGFIRGSTTVGSKYGAFSGSLSQNYTKGSGSSLSYSGGFATNFVTDGESLSFGGNKARKSGLIVDIEDAPASAAFNVMVNGRREGVAYGNKSSLIPLAPFSTYEVRLEPADSGFYHFEESARDVTLYPGNIVSLDYKIKSLQLIFGRLLTSTGKPIANAETSTVKSFNNTTDDNGIFQFEVPYGTQSLIFKTAGKVCKVTLPESKTRTPVLRVGNATCKTF